jgi:hypothetical protein
LIFPVRNRRLNKRDYKYRGKKPSDSFEYETSKEKNNYGVSNEIQKDRANKEFKKRLCQKIPENDKIWSDGDKFEIEKFGNEPYLRIVNEIASKLLNFSHFYRFYF